MKTRLPGFNKYGVSRSFERTIDGITFDSKLEAARYLFLKRLVEMRIIKDLEIQPPFVLIPPFVHQGRKHAGVKYTADFRYMNSNNQSITEDCKGVITRDYRVRRELLLSQQPNLNFYEIKNAHEAGGTGVINGIPNIG